jgi:hypothetical protein
MSTKDDLMSVLRELSPILAGFKLGVIVIGYFGLGSVAKWVIAYWYPFTRWIWDSVAHILSIPQFPIIVKDSLTALVFFLPLGVTAIYQKLSNTHVDNQSHRLLGSLFGFMLLFIICKDVLFSVYSNISSTTMGIAEVDTGDDNFKIIYGLMLIIYISLALFLAFGLWRARNRSNPTSTLGSKVQAGEKFLDRYFNPKKRARLIGLLIGTCISTLLISFILVRKLGVELTPEVSIAVVILAMILSSLMLAIFFAPKKLYVTTGAAIAFIAAAIFYEGFIVVKSFMENVG